LRGRSAGFGTFGGGGVQLAEKVRGERIGGISRAFVRHLGVVVATHVLSWTVWLRQGQSPLECFWEITAPFRALLSLCRIDPGGWLVRRDQSRLGARNQNVTPPTYGQEVGLTNLLDGPRGYWDAGAGASSGFRRPIGTYLSMRRFFPCWVTRIALSDSRFRATDERRSARTISADREDFIATTTLVIHADLGDEGAVCAARLPAQVFRDMLYNNMFQSTADGRTTPEAAGHMAINATWPNCEAPAGYPARKNPMTREKKV